MDSKAHRLLAVASRELPEVDLYFWNVLESVTFDDRAIAALPDGGFIRSTSSKARETKSINNLPNHVTVDALQ